MEIKLNYHSDLLELQECVEEHIDEYIDEFVNDENTPTRACAGIYEIANEIKEQVNKIFEEADDQIRDVIHEFSQTRIIELKQEHKLQDKKEADLWN